MDYGGYVVINNIERPPDRGCYNCKRKGKCRLYELINDGARRSRLPWKCWEKEEDDDDRD